MEWETKNPYHLVIYPMSDASLIMQKGEAFDEGVQAQAKKLIQAYDSFFNLAEQLMNFALEGDYANGVEFYGQDEGRVRAAEALERFVVELKQYVESWQELRRQVGLE